MAKSKTEKKPPPAIKTKTQKISISVERREDDPIEEIESDGSANAFEETERVEEDNFDKLSEK